MVSNSNRLPILFPLFAILFCVKSSVDCITVDLIHRNSPQLPLSEPPATKLDWVNIAFTRSVSRAAHVSSHFSKSPEDMIKSQVTRANGEFIMRLSLGTPPVSQIGIVDTGSDLTWFQCKHCLSCFSQEDPLFDPKLSSTYKNVSCSPSCSAVNSTCKDGFAHCRYGFRYFDGTSNAGILASDTFTFGSGSASEDSCAISPDIVSIPNMIFGCGYYTVNGSTANRSDGIIGLGRGDISFVNQAKNHISQKFSYCLPPSHSNLNATGKISFGNKSIVTGPGTVTTPLKKVVDNPFYIITLESISVNNTTFSLAGEQKYEGYDDIILDSGATFTLLTANIYDKLRAELQKMIPAKALLSVPVPLPLCYKNQDIEVPKIKFKFKEGAEIELHETSVFTKVNPSITCLNIVRNGNLSILGNLAQANYLIGFDLVENVVSFKSSDCTK